MPQLYLIPFAGGNCYSFRHFSPYLDDFEVFSLELPGRGQRISEPLITNFELAVQDIYKQIKLTLNSNNYLIYGHSLGAQIAFKVSRLLEENGSKPSGIVLSGCSRPFKKNEKRYSLPKDMFIKKLKLIGGIPDEVFSNEELFGFFEPILRADFQLSEESNLKKESPFSNPICAIMGDKEEGIEHIRLWESYTTSTFEYFIINGDHFFINQHPSEIAHIIKNFYVQNFTL